MPPKATEAPWTSRKLIALTSPSLHGGRRRFRRDRTATRAPASAPPFPEPAERPHDALWHEQHDDQEECAEHYLIQSDLLELQGELLLRRLQDERAEDWAKERPSAAEEGH